MTVCDVAIVGAGPYGLSAASHLRRAEGLDTAVFGEPMSVWERHMPRGMLLRSPYVATHISDPEGQLTLDDYQAECRKRVGAPVPVEAFVEYGRWFQLHAAPDVDKRTVTAIEPDIPGFRLTLEDGETWKARRVVVAAGITPFASRPPEFRHLPGAMISHSSEHRDMHRFAGKEVLVIGGGQSALESAALIHEVGGQVEVAIRARVVHWLRQRAWVHSRWIGWALYAPPEVGPAGVSHLVARPSLFGKLPRKLQDRLGARSLRPAGAGWLKPRCQDIAIRVGCRVTSATASGDRVQVKLSDGTDRMVDHVLLATGYQVDISRYRFLAPKLVASIRRTDGYPRLDSGFECSAPGLHFIGAPAAWTFGPLMRFVAGSEFTSRALLRRIDRSRQNGSGKQ